MPSLRDIELSNWGEIFLNRDLILIMAYAHEKGIRLHADNGVNLNTVSLEMCEALVKYQFRSLTCSIDGATASTYSIYRKGGNFERVMETIRCINDWKRRLKSRFPILTWQFILFGHNQHEIALVKRIAKSLGMHVFFKLSWDETSESPVSPVTQGRDLGRALGLKAVSRSSFQKQRKRGYLQKEICSDLWHRPQINWDGRILGCCVNYWKDFGNAFTDEAPDPLNNERLTYARRMLMGRVAPRDDIACSTCSYYLEMSKSRRWIKMSDILRFRFGWAIVYAFFHSPKRVYNNYNRIQELFHRVVEFFYRRKS